MIDSPREVSTQITAFVDASNIHKSGDTSGQHGDDWFDLRLEHDTAAAVGAEASDGLTPGLGSSRGDVMAEDSITIVAVDPTLMQDFEPQSSDDASTVCIYFPAGITAENIQIYGNLGPLGSGNGLLAPVASRESVHLGPETSDPVHIYGVSTSTEDGETWGF